MPFSNCNGGRSTLGGVVACKARRHANAMRQHSPIARCPEACRAVVADDDVGRRTWLGVLFPRLSERGCNGDGGREFDLLNAFRAGVSRSAFD